MPRRKLPTQGKLRAPRKQAYLQPKRHGQRKKNQEFQKQLAWQRAQARAIRQEKKEQKRRAAAGDLAEAHIRVWKYRRQGRFAKKRNPVTKNGRVLISKPRRHINNVLKYGALQADVLPPPDETADRAKEYRSNFRKLLNYAYYWRFYGPEGQYLAEMLLDQLARRAIHAHPDMFTQVSIYMGQNDGKNGSTGSEFDIPPRTLNYLKHVSSRASFQELVKDSNGEVVFVVTARTHSRLQFYKKRRSRESIAEEKKEANEWRKAWQIKPGTHPKKKKPVSKPKRGKKK